MCVCVCVRACARVCVCVCWWWGDQVKSSVVSRGVPLHFHFVLKGESNKISKNGSRSQQQPPPTPLPPRRLNNEQSLINETLKFITPKLEPHKIRLTTRLQQVPIYSRLSLSRSRRDPLKHFEISVLRHIRCAELRKIPIEQPNFTNEVVI